MEIADQQAMPDWMTQLIGSDEQEIERTVLVTALNSITVKAKAGAWEEIDTVLKHAPVSKMSSTALMTLLRGTFRFQIKLPTWNAFRDAVAAEFERRGLNVSRLMMGLLPASQTN
jgi:hypothetical protein